VKVLGPRRLVEVLTDWGLHEANGRLRGSLPAELVPPEEGVERAVRGLEIALRTRAPLIARILASTPLRVLRVEIAPDDIPLLAIFDGRPLQDWANAILADKTASGDHARQLAKADTQVSGPFVCAAALGLDDTPGSLREPVVIYDGWHRAAAWVSHCRRRAPYPVTADVIITQHTDPLWREPDRTS